MARDCPVTGKKPMYGNSVSHSFRHTRRRWNVNLQTATIMVDGKMKRVRISTSALRNLRKTAKANPVVAKPVDEKVKETKVEATEVKKETVEEKVKEKKMEATEEKTETPEAKEEAATEEKVEAEKAE